EGRPEVVAIALVPDAPVDQAEMVALVASAERGSDHPYGEAIAREAARRSLALEWPATFQEYPGMGVQATVPSGTSQRIVLIGNAELLEAHGVPTATRGGMRLAFEADQAQQRGETALLVAVEGRAA